MNKELGEKKFKYSEEALRKELERPVITSLLDLDLYKLTMGQFIWEHFPNVPVKFEFTNRTKTIKLPDYIPLDILEDQLGRLPKIKAIEEEIEHLKNIEVRGKRIIKEEYAESLRDVAIPKPKIKIGQDGEYEITFEGDWAQVTYCETLTLSTINELFQRAYMVKTE